MKFYKSRLFINKKINGFLACLLLTIIGIGAFIIIQPKSVPPTLGPDFQYIGQTSFGCPLVCDAPSTQEYYFATDLNKEEIIREFIGARYRKPENIATTGHEEGYSYEALYFTSKKTNDDFLVVFYDERDSPRVRQTRGLRQNVLNNTIVISNYNFRYAQSSLSDDY